MGEKKENNRMVIFIFISILIGFIFWCIYNFLPYEVEVQYVSCVEMKPRTSFIYWSVFSKKTTTEIINYDIYNKEESINALEKINDVDSSRYKFLVVYGSEVITVKKSRRKKDYSIDVKYKEKYPNNKVYIYAIDKTIHIIPLYP